MAIPIENNPPKEIWACILRFDIAEEGLKCRLVCKAWKQIIDEDVLPKAYEKINKDRIEKVWPIHKIEQTERGKTTSFYRFLTGFLRFTTQKSVETPKAVVEILGKYKLFNQSLKVNPLIIEEKVKNIFLPEQIEVLEERAHNLRILWKLVAKKLKIPNAESEKKTPSEIYDYFRSPDNEQKLSGVDTLDGSNSGFTHLPPEIQYLKSIKVLKIWENKLTTFPEEISHLDKLEQIYASKNRLSFLPKGFALLNIRMLHLSHNRFNGIPLEIQSKKLQALTLSYNEICQVTDAIKSFPELEVLDLEHNYLEEFPQQLNEMPQIKQLYLAHNLYNRERSNSAA